MNTVYKYEMDLDTTKLKMHKHAQILSIQMHNGALVWHLFEKTIRTLENQPPN